MENIDTMTMYNITEHCKERYALRIMGKDTHSDIKHYILDNNEKIRNDINKLIHYGELIYTGIPSRKESKNNPLDVYLKDTWIILVDNRMKNVITLYKVDLGLGDEFNKLYVDKMMEKLNRFKEVLVETEKQVEEESEQYRQMLADTDRQIKEYKSKIKNLEELKSAYHLIIDNNCVKLADAQSDVAEVINTFIGKNKF